MSPLGLIGELSLGEELVRSGTLGASGLSGLLVDVTMEVIMVHMLRGELSLASVALDIETSVGNVVPPSLGFVSEHHVLAIVELHPSPHSVGQLETGGALGGLMKPMVQRGLEVISKSGDMAGELAREARNNSVEGKGVSGEVDPSGVGGEDGESLSGPESVVLVPAGSIGLVLAHILRKSIDVKLELNVVALLLQVLGEDGGPLGAGDVASEIFSGSGHIEGLIHVIGDVDVGLQLLEGLVVSVVERASLEVDNAGASVEVIDSSGESDLGSESMSSESGHGELLFIHEAYDVVSNIVHSEAVVVVGVTHVSNVEQPDVSHTKDLIVRVVEEGFKVGSGLDQIAEPDKSRQVVSPSLEESSTELYLVGFGLERSLCTQI